MYLKNAKYLGNIAEISPLARGPEFCLDVYETEFFANPVYWSEADQYDVALKFDHDTEYDIFYFYHVSNPNL